MALTKEGFTVPDGYTADIALFGEINGELVVLLIKRIENTIEGGKWALPGGFVDPQETALQAAYRELLEETSIEKNNINLQHVAVFDEPNRDPRGRIVTNLFMGFCENIEDLTFKAGDDAKDCQLINVNDIMEKTKTLAFDHYSMIEICLNNDVISKKR